MESIWLLVGITAIAGIGGTGLGGALSCMFRKDSDKTVSHLLSFAAGIMTTVVCFDLLTEALRTDGAPGSLWLVVAGVIVGFAVIALHNIPEGMAVAVPLISGGMSKGRSVGITALSGAPTVLGAVLGLLTGLIIIYL